jgi:hypothetical protein
MRPSYVPALPLALGCLMLLALPAAAADAPAKKASLGECSSMLDPFKGKESAKVKDEAIAEYAPLMQAYWKRGCTRKFYEEQVADADLRKRIDAAAPPPKKKS